MLLVFTTDPVDENLKNAAMKRINLEIINKLHFKKIKINKHIRSDDLGKMLGHE